MICRKCGTKLPDNAIRCSNCGIKINMVCPECKALNSFGEKKCKSCGFELIKICSNCGASNLYSTTKCRKCNAPLDKIQTEADNYDTVTPFSTSNVNSYSNYNNIKIEEYNDTASKEEEKEEENKEISIEVESQQEDDFKNEIVYESREEIPFETEPIIPDENFEEIEFNSNTELEKAEIAEPTIEKEEEKTVEDISISTDESSILQLDTEEEIETEIEAEINTEKEETSSLETNNNHSENIFDDIFSQEVEITPIEEEKDEEVEKSLEEENKEEEPEQAEETFDFDSIELKKLTVKKVVSTLKNSLTKHVVALNGPEGCGKTAVMQQVTNILSKQGYVFLHGSCTPLSQITSFGFFQDAFLRIMGFPPFINNTETFNKDFKKSEFGNVFNFLNQAELDLFLNIFYPSKTDEFRNILENKKRIFNIMEKVIKSFLVSTNLIITIDNFELLDGASYDFIMYMLENNFFNNRLKLLVSYQENKSIQSYFDTEKIDDKIFESIYIKKFNNEELVQAVNRSIHFYAEEFIPPDLLLKLIEKSNGNALRFEQEIALLFDTNYLAIENNKTIINEENKIAIEPENFEELIKLRINALTPSAKNVLFMAAIMGYRFATNILCSAVALSKKKANEVIDLLRNNLYINPVDNYTYEFKSLTLWKLIYKEAKADLLYKENSERLYNILKPLILSSNLQKLISCTEALTKNESFYIWQQTSNLASKLGDTNLFVIAQKQCLKLIEEQELDNSEEIRTIIYEQIGKLLFEKSPKESVTYLANILDTAIKENNKLKILDLSGFFVKSCYASGNYFGATEAVDAIISCLESETAMISELDLALIKTRKLKALFYIGNCEQIINLVKEEILPNLEIHLQNLKSHTNNNKLLITDGWILASTTLAKAYAMQGNNEVFNTIEQIKLFIEKNNYNQEFYSTQLDIIEAFACTMTGNITKSNETLNKLTLQYRNKNMQANLLAEWNLVNIINRIILEQFTDLKADLFELAAFSNNISEHFIKNIIKLILGFILKEEGNIEKALEIFNEQITYFAKEKVAIGAMLSWAMIVKLSIETGEIDKALNTATKSLEIAQSSKINNYFFIIYFQKYIADIYLLKGDLIAVKMYLEKAIMLAKQHDLKYQLIQLYLDYAKYMEEYMKAKYTYSHDYVKLTAEMYERALQLAKELKIDNLADTVRKERGAFRTFCQLKSIEIY